MGEGHPSLLPDQFLLPSSASVAWRNRLGLKTVKEYFRGKQDILACSFPPVGGFPEVPGRDASLRYLLPAKSDGTKRLFVQYLRDQGIEIEEAQRENTNKIIIQRSSSSCPLGALATCCC